MKVIDITLGLCESELGVGSKIGFNFKVTDNFKIIEFNMNMVMMKITFIGTVLNLFQILLTKQSFACRPYQ